VIVAQAIICGLIAFAGYAIGRIGHVTRGHLKAPHHWIYGLGLLIIGLVFCESFWGLYILSFGVGLFISDLKDFLDLKFYGVDRDGIKKFWEID